jgi:DDE superfamily endonuclease
MPPVRTGRRGWRYTSPPPELQPHNEAGIPWDTPHRSAVFTAHLIAEGQGFKPGDSKTEEQVHEAFGVPPRSQRRILATGEVRTFHNRPDSGPDPRGRPRAFTHTETAAIASYLDDPTTSLDDKGAPWKDIAQAAGVELPKTTHFKPPGLRTVQSQTIQHSCKKDEGIINAVCDEEKELNPDQARNRMRHCFRSLIYRPHSLDWFDTAVCDEFHFGIGPQTTRYIKQKIGPRYRYMPYNMHRKKVTSKDTKAKAREKDHLKLLNVFVVIGYNYRRMIPYIVPNRVGKMTTEIYTEHILPTILPDLQKRGLTLIQDTDSAHKSQVTIAWAAKHHLPLITLPGVSPDLSIMESIARPLKRKFHSRRSTSEPGALARFTRIFEQEMDQTKIQRLYNKYTKRLHDCIRAKGQMTKY